MMGQVHLGSSFLMVSQRLQAGPALSNMKKYSGIAKNVLTSASDRQPEKKLSMTMKQTNIFEWLVFKAFE